MGTRPGGLRTNSPDVCPRHAQFYPHIKSKGNGNG